MTKHLTSMFVAAALSIGSVATLNAEEAQPGCSKWTQPMSKVLEAMGEEGKVLCQAMKATVGRFDSGELQIPKRDPGTGGAHLKIVPTLKEAVAKWESKYGKVTAGYPK